MPYYNYHAKAQNLIKTGHCILAELVISYKKISPALLLYFDNHRALPIREHKYNEYISLLKEHNVKIENKT